MLVAALVPSVPAVSTTAPYNGGGRPRTITGPIMDALCEHLREKPDLYLDEMAVFLWDEFKILPATTTISRRLKSIRWSKKVAHRVAREQNLELRDYYSLLYLPSDPTTLYLWTNRVVTNGLDSAGRDGHPLA